ncbi:MAG: ADP-ribosylation factor-like protein [Candidatus Lokiarchaeota archaeon]
MSENKNLINIFSKFLHKSYIKKDFKEIEDLINLPLKAFKFFTSNDIETIEDLFKIEKVKEIEKFIKAITISSILLDKDNDLNRLDARAQKIICVGLDNAGKTAILSRFGEKMHINDLAHLEPTKGVNRKVIKTPKLDLFVWDFGGQLQYRNKYVENPEKFFLGLDLLMYVIDVQDAKRFEESFEYFDEIVKILISLEENPYILIFIHKYDPDIKDKPEILLHIEYIKDRVMDIFREKEQQFEYDIYLTSIYSLISNEPEFSKFIKNTMRRNYSLTDPTLKKVEGLGKTLEEVMNAVIRLSESISKQLNDMDSRLRAIESGAFHIAQSGVPIEIQTEEQGSRGGDAVRSKVLDELKDLFDKKRRLER